MMTVKQAYVFSHLESGEICVFPSEVSARYWLQQYVYMHDTAIRADRAMSWDTFSDLFLQSHALLQKADAMTRLLFVEQFSEHHEFPYFHTENAVSAPRIKQYLSTILPQLKAVCLSPAFLHLPKELRQDYQLLYAGYSQFLSKQGLYEPSYQGPAVPDERKTYRILFSDCQFGCADLLRKLDYPQWLQAIPSPKEEVRVIKYENHIQEIRETLRTVRHLLDEGVDAQDIIIATASPDMMLPVLSDLSRLYDVPLSIRNGTKPSETSAGRFFQRLRDVYSYQFSLDTMKTLLLDQSIPWKKEQLGMAHAFVAAAVDLSIDQGSLSGDDLWLQNLGKEPVHGARLADWYRHFKEYVLSFCRADTIAELERCLHSFQKDYFGPDEWKGKPGEPMYTFCMDALDTLGKDMKVCGVESHKELLSLFLSFLDSLMYVPQEQEDGGVKVYRWTDCSTMDAPHMLYLAMDWNSTQLVDRPLSCLPDSINKEERQEEDLTDGNLMLASTGGAILSYHVTDYDRECRAPSCSVSEKPAECTADVYHDEQALWASRPGGVGNHFQGASFRAFSRHDEVVDYAERKERLAPALTAPPREGVDPLRNLSSTSLDAFSACPFAWACKYVLGVQELDFTVNLVDDKTIGTMLHKTYEKFFRRVGVFHASELEHYRSLLATCFDESLDETYGLKGPDPACRVWIIHTYRGLCAELLEQEKEFFEGCSSYGLERVLETPWNDELSLNGRIDRIISLGGEEVAVVDYKSGDAPMSATNSKNCLFSAEERFNTLQLPFYLELLKRREGKETVWAGYYSIRGKKYVEIWSKDFLQVKAGGEELLEKRLSQYEKALHDGSFPATPGKEPCGGCRYRSACRRRFSAR